MSKAAFDTTSLTPNDAEYEQLKKDLKGMAGADKEIRSSFLGGRGPGGRIRSSFLGGRGGVLYSCRIRSLSEDPDHVDDDVDVDNEFQDNGIGDPDDDVNNDIGDLDLVDEELDLVPFPEDGEQPTATCNNQFGCVC